MKKYIMLFMMLIMSTYSFAEDSTAIKMTELERYELKINHRRLASFLNISSEQMKVYDIVLSQFENDMIFALVEDGEDARHAAVKSAVKKNVKNMHYVLKGKQYEKYLMLLNLTLEHRGFETSKIGE